MSNVTKYIGCSSFRGNKFSDYIILPKKYRNNKDVKRIFHDIETYAEIEEMNNNYVNKWKDHVMILRCSEIVIEYILCNLVKIEVMFSS